MKLSLNAGIDEAGRGPVIGPMVMACAVLDDESCESLRAMGVRDSKKMTPKRREKLYPIVCDICTEWKTVHITAMQIDRLRAKMSLNQVEAVESAKMIMALKTDPKSVYIDSTDTVTENYKKRIEDYILGKYPGKKYPQLVCEHRADDTYIEASAASVLAKVERDRAIEKLKSKWGDFGSGYPADPLTKAFISKLMKEDQLPYYVRKSWNTVQRNIVNKKKQSALNDFV